jgi:GTP-binding protein
MTLLFVLLDVRLAPQAIDLVFIEQLGNMEIPFSLVFTKADKLSATAAQRQVEAYKNKLLEQWEELPELFVISSTKKTGRQEIIDYIEKINREIGK